MVEEAREIARDANHPYVYRNEILIALGYLGLVEKDYRKVEEIFEEIFTSLNESPEGSLGMVYAACGLGDYSTAKKNMQKALQPSSPYRIPLMATLCIPAAAIILAHEGETERAVELIALASHHPTSPAKMLAKWPQIRELRAELEGKLPPEIHSAALERGQRLDIDETLATLTAQFSITDSVTPKMFASPLGVSHSLIDPLSEREMEVLQLLKTELSGPEMARELMVSLNTIRFHTKNIYTKLEVNNRRSAVNRAIELGL
jgi:ATP/maltotriose-dependent transcriptional regulator MalT